MVTNDQNRPLLEVAGVSKTYGKQTVLKNVSFTMQPGERVALMGPSGSGKSTLLNLLSGIDHPDNGQILLASNDLARASASTLTHIRRHHISTIFQFFHLLPTLTASENIELTLQIAGVAAQERKNRVNELLEAVELTSHANAHPDTLSGGESQRIAIARALAHRPKLILADEPTGSLDSKSGQKTLDLLKNLTEKHQIALFLVTHSPEAAATCDRTLNLHDGTLI
ncbi:MAG: hypothetical protein CMF28_02310 [Kiritimatiellaceae bacterium]|nr:hypothetical protein [Kiritimatiellaceae bacterium]|tara:strand:- start:1229 stop:1906 length:678 start_codon:yes stop_codon:yes gene_type:complete